MLWAPSWREKGTGRRANLAGAQGAKGAAQEGRSPTFHRLLKSLQRVAEPQGVVGDLGQWKRACGELGELEGEARLSGSAFELETRFGWRDFSLSCAADWKGPVPKDREEVAGGGSRHGPRFSPWVSCKQRCGENDPQPRGSFTLLSVHSLGALGSVPAHPF